MDLNKVRERLIELEDVIIRGLCDRANYKLNSPIYIHNSNKFKYNNSFHGTYLDFMFKSIENVHSISGRYECFDERSYYTGLEPCQVERNYNYQLPKNLIYFSKQINFSPWIKIIYLNFLQTFCKEGDDTNYGDTVLSDIFNLQAISKRIHYGILVMEAKYSENKTLYDKYLTEGNDLEIINALKNTKVEDEILQRIHNKTVKLGFSSPEKIVEFFRNAIIPMTIQIELEFIYSKKL